MRQLLFCVVVLANTACNCRPSASTELLDLRFTEQVVVVVDADELTARGGATVRAFGEVWVVHDDEFIGPRGFHERLRKALQTEEIHPDQTRFVIRRARSLPTELLLPVLDALAECGCGYVEFEDYP